MTEQADAASSSSDAAAQRAAEQARLRKERREAKIKAGGTARLNKITGIGGRIVGDTDEATSATTTTDPVAKATISPPRASQAHADPEEVDISEHFYEPKATARSAGSGPTLSESQLRQMMLGFDGSGTGTPASGTGTPSGAANGLPNMEDDPIMKMMTQMMGSAGPGAAGSPFPGMPGAPSTTATAQPSPYHTIWRLIHALVALSLGLYLTLFTSFSGTKAERQQAAVAHVQHLPADDENEQHKRMFFWLFATSEAVLLTTRLFLDKGRAPPPGFLWTAVGFIPEPFKGYLTVGLKYGQIFTTVRTDILTCMFVLGACSWLRA